MNAAEGICLSRIMGIINFPTHIRVKKNNDYVHGGLSDMGREAIAEMNRLGIMIDISHPSKDSIMQTLKLSVAPIIASHSSARKLTNHTRNLDDEMLRAVKSKRRCSSDHSF
ncbi:MAG: membrane dipeptidase [Pseudohongiellaceae bacterium]